MNCVAICFRDNNSFRNGFVFFRWFIANNFDLYLSKLSRDLFIYYKNQYYSNPN